MTNSETMLPDVKSVKKLIDATLAPAVKIAEAGAEAAVLVPEMRQALADTAQAGALATAAAGLSGYVDTAAQLAGKPDGSYLVRGEGTVYDVAGGTTRATDLTLPIPAQTARWYIPRLFAGLADATAPIQAMIDMLPKWGTLDGGGRTYTVKSVYYKSFAFYENASFITKAGAEDFVSPITIDGRPTDPGNLESGLKQHMYFRNWRVDGNRQNQTNIVNTAENGGRHGFRILGRLYDAVFENCEGINTAGDGMELFRSTARNLSDDTDHCFRRVTIRGGRWNWNRRHGLSIDSFRGVRFKGHPIFNHNGLNLPSVTTPTNAENYAEGVRGDTVIVNGEYQLYGNGVDVEGYGIGSGIDGFDLIDVEALGNARAGLLFFDKRSGESASAPFVPRKNIHIVRGHYDEGVDPSRDGAAISFTPPYAQRAAAHMYEDINIESARLDGYLLMRSATGRIGGRTVINTTTGQSVLADYANVDVGAEVKLSKPVYLAKDSGGNATATVRQGATLGDIASSISNTASLPGTQVRRSAPASAEYALIGTLPAGNGLPHRLQVEVIGNGYNGTEAGHLSIQLGNFGSQSNSGVEGGGYLYRKDRTGAEKLGVVAYKQADGSVQVYARAQAGQYAHGIVRALYAQDGQAAKSLSLGAWGTTVPGGTVVFDSNTTPQNIPVPTPANLTAPAAPALTVSSGQSGTLTYVAAQTLQSTPYTISYRLVYDWTPGATGSATQFAVGTLTGYAVTTMSAGAVVKATNVPVAVGLGGGLARVWLGNQTVDTVTVTAYVSLAKS